MAILTTFIAHPTRTKTQALTTAQTTKTPPPAISATLTNVTVIPGLIGLAVYFFITWIGRPPLLADHVSITGFTNPNNNAHGQITMATPTSFALLLTTQGNETHAATATITPQTHVLRSATTKKGKPKNRQGPFLAQSQQTLRSLAAAWTQGWGYSPDSYPAPTITIDRAAWNTYAATYKWTLPNGSQVWRKGYQWFMAANQDAMVMLKFFARSPAPPYTTTPVAIIGAPSGNPPPPAISSLTLIATPDGYGWIFNPPCPVPVPGTTHILANYGIIVSLTPPATLTGKTKRSTFWAFDGEYGNSAVPYPDRTYPFFYPQLRLPFPGNPPQTAAPSAASSHSRKHSTITSTRGPCPTSLGPSRIFQL